MVARAVGGEKSDKIGDMVKWRRRALDSASARCIKSDRCTVHGDERRCVTGSGVPVDGVVALRQVQGQG
jgi:hypothetical protein